MGLTLYCSHRLEDLGEALAAQLRLIGEAGHGDKGGSGGLGGDAEATLFEPTTLVAPNQNIRKWLQLQIARRNGIAIHLQFEFLEKLFWRWLNERNPLPADAPELIEPHTLPWLVLAALVGAPDAGLGGADRTGGGVGGDAGGGTEKSGVANDALAPLRGYIFRGEGAAVGGAPSRTAAAKAWQLAERLAGLIRDYEFHRPDWVAYWRDASQKRPHDLPNTPLAEAEAALYRRIFMPGGLCEIAGRVRGKRLATLPQWALERLAEPPANRASGEASVGTPEHRQPLHLFSFPQVSQFHRHLLFALAAERPVHLYLLNLGGIPADDLPAQAVTPWLPLSRARKVIRENSGEWLAAGTSAATGAGGAEGADGDAVHARVRDWGRVGAEGLYLIAGEPLVAPLRGDTTVHWSNRGPAEKTAQVNGGAHPKPSAPMDLLHGVQGWLLGNSKTSVPPAEGLLDESLVLARCPSIQREVEAVYHCILRNLSAHKDLLQTDVLVLVPNMERYRPAIHAVFDRGEAGLGYNLGDVSGAGDSLYAQAVQAALALIEGRFTRAEVFEFLRNLCVQAALRIDAKRLSLWSQWADALHVFAEDAVVERTAVKDGGAAEAMAETKAAAVAADRGLFGWRRALARLQLGRVMAAPSPVIGDDDAVPEDFAGIIPYADAETGESTDLDGFIHTLELLSDAARRVRSAAHDGERWRRELFALLSRFLAVPEEHPEEQAVQSLVAGLFERLAETVRLAQTGALFGGPLIPALLVREALIAGLREIPSRQGRYLSGGVTISTQFPQRPIPFRVIFMLGLDENSFPAKGTREVIDLRRDQRRLGDVDSVDLERFMFLEALLSARERLYLSYVHRDLQEDREVAPCVLLAQLCELVAQAFPTRPLPEVKVPLHGHAAQYFLPRVAAQDGSVQAKTGFDWNYSQRDRALAARVVARDAAAAMAAAGADSALQSPAPSATPATPAWGRLLVQPPSVETGCDVQLHELARFVRHPLRTMLNRQLGVSDSGEDDWEAEAADAEPFFLSGTIRRSVERRMVAEYLATRSRPLALAAASAQLELRHKLGETPAGAFQVNERAQLLADLENQFWTRTGATVEELLQRIGPGVFRSLVIFGDSARARPEAVRFPPLRLMLPMLSEAGGAAGAAMPIRLHGLLEPVWTVANGATIHLVAPVAKDKPELKNVPPPEIILPVLAVAALRAGREAALLAAGAMGAADAVAAAELFQFESAYVHVLYRERLISYRCGFDAAQAQAALLALVHDFSIAPQFEFLPWDLLMHRFADLAGWARDGQPDAEARAKIRQTLLRELDGADEEHARVRISNLETVSGVVLPADPVAVALRRLALLFQLEMVDDAAWVSGVGEAMGQAAAAPRMPASTDRDSNAGSAGTAGDKKAKGKGGRKKGSA